ncbi:MAG TPA: CpaF family protein, partial [Methylomirabilota bacterium]|nr:CpaF family protein [Methylomirabilota bacterium]
MFGKRSADLLDDRPPKPAAPAAALKPKPAAPAPAAQASAKPQPAAAPPPPTAGRPRKTDEDYDRKTQIFGALIDTIDLSQLSKMDLDQAREEIRDIVNDIITVKNVVMSIAEQEDLLEDICNDVLGYGPLEPLLARDEIADIMVNGA